MGEPVKPGIACAYCKAQFSSIEGCNWHVELEKPCRRRRRRLTRRAMEFLRQRTRADDDSRLGVNHVEEQAFDLAGGNPVEESETSQGDQSIQKRKTCQFCLFTKTNCKCKVEQKEVNSTDDNSRMKVDRPRKRINLIKKKQVMSSNVEEEEAIESVGYWVASSKHPSISHSFDQTNFVPFQD